MRWVSATHILGREILPRAFHMQGVAMRFHIGDGGHHLRATQSGKA